MNLADELRKLQELHQNGSLTVDEFAAAKAKVLAQDNAATAPAEKIMQEHLEDLRAQNSVEQLDREWSLERERYMMTTWQRGAYGNTYGMRQIPTKGMSVLSGIMIAAFGALWIAIASSIASGMGGPATLFPLFGVLFILVGVGMSIYAYSKATQYEQAEARYRRRRAELLGARATPERGFADERIQQ